MAGFRTLQDFLHALHAAGELVTVDESVSPLLDPGCLAERQMRRNAPVASGSAKRFDPARASIGGRALLFNNIEGCDFPLAMNLFGSCRRVEMALGVDDDPRGIEAIADRIASLTRPQPPHSLLELARKAGEFLPLLRVPPKSVRHGRCQDVVKLASRGEVDLRRLPIIQCWPLDGNPEAVGLPMSAAAAGTAGGQGRYITLAGMHTIHADDRDVERPASHNIGMYRSQLLDATRLAMHWHMHHDGASHWRSWKKLGRRMPIAICLGGESVLAYGATAPLPPGISELLMSGFLNGGGIPMVRAQTVPLRVPANSEIVIEGWVSTECGGIDWEPGAEPLGPGAVFEGPFGDHTGFYSMPDRYPIMEVTAITHAHNAIYPATIVGLPPQEDYWLGKATERIFLPLLKTLVNDIDDYHLPLFGCFHNAAFVQIRKAYPLQGRRVMHSVWGAGQMAWTKMICVVDGDVNVHDEAAVLRRVFERCDFLRDVEFAHGPLDILDHAAPGLGAGTKIGFDATTRMRGEEVHGIALGEPRLPGADEVRLCLESICPHVAAAAAPAWGHGRCLFVSIEKRAACAGARAIEKIWSLLPNQPGAGDFVVVVDAGIDLADWEKVLFFLAANSDFERDLYRQDRRIAIDATRKVAGDARNGHAVRRFPPLVGFEPFTIERARQIESGPSFQRSIQSPA
ncbi:MAG: UbiD family decarboxylase [Planctomycetes bacterium]|nr:UbiD family decarboxylase [Planctomycetota bacterium]